jgi:hypothetical protein
MGGTEMSAGYARGRRLAAKFATIAMLLIALSGLGTSGAAAVTGSGGIVGHWSCGPGQTISMTFYVTGSGSTALVTLDIYYKGTGMWAGEDWIVNGFAVRPGYTTIRPPSAGRTIYKFTYKTYGNANLRSWTKNCSG